MRQEGKMMTIDKPVLVVDDDRQLLEELDEHLSRQGVPIDTCDHPEIPEKLSGYHALIVDLHGEKRDGLDVLKRLAELFEPPPVILISGWGDTELETFRHYGQYLGLEVIGILAKPLNLRALKALLDRCPNTGHAHGEANGDSPHLDQIIAHFQPQYRLPDLRLTGFEVLARWEHPDRGILEPGHFLPYLIATNRNRELLQKMLEAGAQAQRSFAAIGHDIHFSINLTTQDLAHREFPHWLLRQLNAWDVKPSACVLEIPESELVEHDVTAYCSIIRTHMLGVQISIDDFGRRFANLERLAHLPFNEIKIDRMLLEHGGNLRNLLDVTVRMCQQLRTRAVLEGVESEQDLYRAWSTGVENMQGYLLGKPMPLSELLNSPGCIATRLEI